MPLLGSALLRLLEELPSPADGLSRSERGALQATAAGAQTPAAAFVAAQELEEAPFLGDAWFYRTLAQLGQGPHRLVESASGGPRPTPPPLGDPDVFATTPLRLTREGARVLDGEADGVELLGIDRWVGGTHLMHGRVWRWNPRTRRLVAPG